MFNRSEIMKSAWAKFRKHYRYPKNSFKSIGRDRFVHCLKMAWARAKTKARNAAEATATNEPVSITIARLNNQIEMLQYKSFRFDIAKERRNLQTQISQLERLAA